MRTAAAAWLVSLALLIGPMDARLGTHAVRGVVKSINASSLTITRPGRGTLDMVFALTSSTAREGMIAVGTTVSIRYVTDGRALIATAISASAGRDRENSQGDQEIGRSEEFSPDLPISL